MKEGESKALRFYLHPTRWGWFWIVVSLIIPLCFAAWRVRYGVDLTDEGFYVVPPLRYALGDLPYRDEWWTSLTGFDLLLWPVFEMWPNIPLYVLRLLGIGLFGAGMVPVVLWMGRKIGYASASIAAGLCIWAGASPLTLPTPSYNRIPEALLPAAMALALIGIGASTNRRKWIFGIVAGVLHGLSALAYRPCLILLVFPGLVFVFGLFGRDDRRQFWHVAVGWLVGTGLVACAFGGFLYTFGLMDDYLRALAFFNKVMPSFVETLPERWHRFYRDIPPALPFTVTFGIGFSVLTILVTWMADQWQPLGGRLLTMQSAFFAAVVAVGIWLLVANWTPFNIRGVRFHYQSAIFWMGLGLFAAYMACPVRTLGRWEWPRWRETEVFFGFALAGAAEHGFFSGNGFVATKSFATPIMLSGVALWLYKGQKVKRLGGNNTGTITMGLAWAIAVVACAASWKQGYQNVYRDAPLAELTAQAPFSALRSLRTTPMRASQWNALEDVLATRIIPGERLLTYGSSPMINYLTHSRPGLPYSWDYSDARPYGAAWLASRLEKPRYAVTTMLYSATHGRLERPGRTLSFSYGAGGDALHSFVRATYCPVEAPYPFILWAHKDMPEAREVVERAPLFHQNAKLGHLAPVREKRFSDWSAKLESSQPRRLGQRGCFKIVGQSDEAYVSFEGGDDAPVLMLGFSYDLPKGHKAMPASINVRGLDLSTFSGNVQLFCQDRVGKRWQRFVHSLSAGNIFDYSGLDVITRPEAEKVSAGIILRPTTPGDTIALRGMELIIGFWCFAGNKPAVVVGDDNS